jgi:hypothetical protein
MTSSHDDPPLAGDGCGCASCVKHRAAKSPEPVGEDRSDFRFLGAAAGAISTVYLSTQSTIATAAVAVVAAVWILRPGGRR